MCVVCVCHAGELISSVSSDVQEVRSAVKHTISMGIKSITQVTTTTTTITAIAPQITVVTLTHSLGCIIVLWQIGGGIVSLFLISARLTTILTLLLPALITVSRLVG